MVEKIPGELVSEMAGPTLALLRDHNREVNRILNAPVAVKPDNAGVSTGTQKQPMQSLTASNELPVPIGDNLIARVPFPMTEEDFDMLIGTLNLWKKKLTRQPAVAQPVSPDVEV